VDTGGSEPSWAAAAWNTVRNIARRRHFPTRVRAGMTVLVLCGAVAAAAGVYTAQTGGSSPESGAVAGPLGAPIATLT
jgi:hypothetical protein